MSRTLPFYVRYRCQSFRSIGAEIVPRLRQFVFGKVTPDRYGMRRE
ncbi:MAG: hypothetical protein LBH00_11895 [Planctomycetaceae bacterium]|nr:hypothetical protein [Planctomycetaceae bacterium]